MDLVVAVYDLTKRFPKSEIYGLISQMRRAAVSISSNIAEGKMRGTRKDYCHFLLMAFGSGAEIETQIEIAKRLKFGKGFDYSVVDQLLEEIMRMLNTLIKKMTVPNTYNLTPIT